MAKAGDVVMADAARAEVLSVPILETVKAAQLQNGLRHRDFQRYRQYCARRLQRVRKSVKFTHGKGKTFVGKKVDAETATEARFLYIPLYNAERAWSYAMQLKEDDNLDKAENGDEANSRIKFHLNGRLRKAADWSQRLADICAERADARTSLEAEAYAAFMAGNLAFHREEHRAALDKFATARRIYSDLSQVGTPSQRELFATFSEELQPFIRFCEHRLALQGRRQGVEVSSALDLSSSGDSASNALLQSKIDVVLLEARKQKVANLGSVEWKGKQIAIPSQELGMALLGPDEVAAKLEALPVVSAGESDKKRDVLFLSLLSAYDSVLQLIKTEIGRLQQQSKSGSALVHTDIEVLQVLEEYVRFQKLAKQVERSVSVYQKLREFTQTTGELTHILDMLVQSVGDILSIPSLSELEPLRAAKYSAYQATFRAVRAATIAQSYQQQRRFAEAMSLYQYAAGFLGEADEILSVHPASKDDVLQEFGKSLGEELGGAVSRTTAQSFLQQSTASEPDVRSQLEELELSDAKSKSKSKAKATVPKTRKSLLERQDEFAAGSAKAQFEVVKLPPAFQAVPSKPMLFDVAFNELEMPDITERTKTEEEKQAEAAEAAKQASSGGLFGWFRK